MKKLFSLLTALLFVGSMWAAVGYELVVSKAALENNGTYVLLVNDCSTAYSGTVNKGHLQTSGTWSCATKTAGATVTPPASGTIVTVTLINVSDDTYKIKDSNNKFITATAAKSGSFSLADTDADGWEFSGTNGLDAQYQKTNAQAWLRSYSNSEFRSYANTSNGAVFYLAKVVEIAESAVTITNPSHGTISVKNGDDDVTSGAEIAQGTELTVSIADVVGYRFSLKYKVGDGDWTSIENGGTITMPASAITITADELALFNVAVAVNDANMGSATINGGTTAIYVDDDDDINLVATPNAGYEFVNWTVSDEAIVLDDANASTTTALAGASGTITANFQLSDDPSVSTDKASLAFGSLDHGASSGSLPLTLTSANLTEDVTLVATTSPAGAVFSVYPAVIKLADWDANNQKIVTVYASTVSVGTFNGTLTISSEEFDNVTVSLSVTIEPLYTVTLKDDDSELEQTTAGAAVVLPSREGCTGYTFAGWTKTWTSAQSEWTATAPTIIPAGSYTPTADEDLYPVYTKTGSEFKLSVVNSETTYYVGAKGSGSYLSAVTDANDAVLFSYDGNYLSFDDSGTKTYISSAGDNTTLTIDTDIPSYTWTEEGTTTVTYQTSATGNRYLALNASANPKRFAPYGSTFPKEFTKHANTLYISEPNCTSTDVEAVVETSSKAVKVLKNGMLLIEKNGRTYNAQGQLVK